MELTHDEGQVGARRSPPRGLIILGLVLLQGILALWNLASLQSAGGNDPAWYYAVARNIAHGKANPDNVLWTYLGHPASVQRPAGDYWGAGWPYALGFLMRFVGDSPVAAIRICAVLSLFLPVTVFLLLQRLTSRWWLAASGAVMVCLQIRLFPAMVVPEVTLSYLLTTTAGFVLFLGVLKDRDRPSLLRLFPSAFVLTLPIWLRGEGFVPLLAATIGILAAPWSWRQRLRCVVGFAALAGICLFPYILYNMHFFGRITPEPRSLTPLMTDYKQLYEVGSQPSLEAFGKLGPKGIVGLRIEALEMLAEYFFAGEPYLLLLAGICGPLLWWVVDRRAKRSGAARSGNRYAPDTFGASGSRPAIDDRPDRGRAAGIITLWSFIVLSAVVPLLAAPIVNNNSRFVTNAAPVLCVLAVWTIAPLLRYRWTVNLGLLFVALFLFSYVQWPFHLRKPWTTAWKGRFWDVPTCLSPGNHPALNADDTVLTDTPCRLSAQLDVGSIMVPMDDTVVDTSDGERKYQRFVPSFGFKWKVASTETCRQVIQQYHPHFILAMDGSILDQFVSRLSDLPLHVVCRGKNQDGRGYTWYAIAEGAR